MITLAGISVRDQTPELQAMLDGIWTSDYDAYRRPHSGYNTLYHLPVGDDQNRPPKLGVLRWPCDLTRWATMYIMVSDAELRDIIKVANVFGEGYGYYGDLVIGDGTNSITASYMKILPPRPITQTPRKWDDPYPSIATPDLWLLHLVDKRYDWQSVSAGGVAGAVEGVGTVSGTATWANYIKSGIDAITSYVSSTTVDTIPSVYPVPGNPVKTDQVDYWLGNTIRQYPWTQFLQAMIEHTGGGFSRDLSGDILRVWRPLNAKAAQKAAYDANLSNIIAGGLIDKTAIANSLPGYCTVYSNNISLTNGIGSLMRPAYITMNPGVSSVGPYSTTDGAVSIPEVGSAFGDLLATATIYSDYPIAGRTLAAFKPVALQLATDWYNWRFASRVDATFRGIINWPLSASDWCVEWSTGCYGTQPTTRVYPLPLYNWDRYGSPQNKEIVRTPVVGSKGGNAALGNLITILKTYGYVDDLTT